MRTSKWQEVLLSRGIEDHVWELFHENSKTGRYDNSLSENEVFNRMQELQESLPFQGYPVITLPPTHTPLACRFDEVISKRTSVRDLMPSPLSLETLGTILQHSYGETRDFRSHGFPRAFRVVPSAGALYPLELFFYTAQIAGLEPGIYHYNPTETNLRLVIPGDKTKTIAEALVQPHLAEGASLILFITAIFERSVFKYGDRGYRFVFLEAGHVAQNINLVANAFGQGCINIGGFFDREIDDLLRLDGVVHSTIYMSAIGTMKERHNE